MRFKHQRQAVKGLKSKVAFDVQADKWGFLTVTAILQGKSLTQPEVNPWDVEKTQRKMASELSKGIFHG